MAGLYHRLIAWLRGAGGTGPIPKLSQPQVLQIAQTAVSAERGARQLTLATRAVKNGRIVWSVSEPAIGSVLVVDIDDETAMVLAVRRAGLR